MLITALEDIKLNPLEYCYTVGDHSPSASTFKVRIPKMMPLISPSDKPVKLTFNNNITVNANDCKPTIGTTVTTQGYYTADRFQNVNLSHKGLVVNEGSPLIIAVMDNNVKKVFVTGNI